MLHLVFPQNTTSVSECDGPFSLFALAPCRMEYDWPGPGLRTGPRTGPVEGGGLFT